MQTNKIISLILRLAEESSKGKLDWEQTDIDEVFQLTFPNYTLRIYFELGEGGGNDYYITIYDQEGSVIESTSDVELKDELQDSFSIFKNIYESARRNAMGVDKALNEILNALGSPKEISPPDSNDKSEPSKKDLPF